VGECAQPTLHWKVHLARRAPLKAVACLGAALAVGLGAFGLWGNAWVALGAGLLLLTALSDFMLPLHYRIDSRGITCRQLLSLRRLDWSQVRRVWTDGEGIKVSPLAHPSRLEAYRGIYLWPEGNRAEVLAALRQYRGEAAP